MTKDKMKLIPVFYFGFTAMDRRFSSPMLPWIVSEVRKRDYQEKLSLGIEDGNLQAYNADFEIQFSHNISHMTRFSQADFDASTFLYLLRDDGEQLLYCYLFQAMKQADVSELYQRMKEHTVNQPAAPVRSTSTSSNLTSLCVDISPSSSNFFEVLYIGKIKVWHKKVPDTFIDDALIRFKQHDLEKNRKKLARLKSEIDLRRGSIGSLETSRPASMSGVVPKLQRSHSLLANLTIKSPDIDRKVPSCIERITESDDAENDGETTDSDKTATDGNQINEEFDLARLERELKMVPDLEDHNRTMVLQVDRTDLRLISPDRKVILLHKQHKEVTTCIQGSTNSEHFGFISREGNSLNTFIGYVFKCESSSIASEAVAAITQAFNNAEAKAIRPSVTSCDHCPMVWYHRLCCEVENLSDRKTQAAILRKIEQLDDEEQNLIITKYRGAETDSLREQNEFLMMLLRAHCEMKQGRHVHDTAENRSEFLNQYLGNTIFRKARRSISNSFEHLLKRRSSKDDFASQIKDLTLPVQTISRETSPNIADSSDKESDGFRSRSSTVSSQDYKDKRSNSPDRTADKLKSPMMDIFFKVGSNPKTPTSDVKSHKIDNGSWRQAIFKRVVTQNNTEDHEHKLTKDELRELWRKAIYQAILLGRMEKENARIRAKQEESAVKRIKLEYEEMRSDTGEGLEIWDAFNNTDSRIKCDIDQLSKAIRQGIPRGKRGDVWHYLADEFDARIPPINLNKYPNYIVPYETLLKQLTSHQHAILIDLGRTFPSHSYYSSPLGPGQLALFNLLKAYSLLDPEVGYCQGLSFVAGVLLLHMEESQAFSLLRHLMYRRSLRKQYLPDMVGLQVKLYQLSRLIHDNLPDLYAHFDLYEVAPTLYAAPWLLTNFASQFPLGFVTRVFDLIFLESPDVIFSIILALLTIHKDSIMLCNTFEDIMNYLKVKLPGMDKTMMDRIISQVYSNDITKQLNEYVIEYFVLQEEIQSLQVQTESFQRLEAQNRILSEQNKALMDQLETILANAQRLEKDRTALQSSVSKLETDNRTLETNITTLGGFINDLIEDKVDVEISGDVQRIVSHIKFTEKRKSNTNIFNMFKKDNRVNPNKFMVKSLSTGKIGLHNNDNDDYLRANITKKNPFFSSAYKESLDNKQQSLNILNRIDVKVNDLEQDRNELLSNLQQRDDALESPTSSIDSGVCEISPKESPADVVNNNNKSHPLSNCDINFTYNTRELKRMSSVKDMLKTSGVK